jgi:hypothetical protein
MLPRVVLRYDMVCHHTVINHLSRVVVSLPDRASQRELAATRVTIQSEKQRLLNQKPGYFDKYENMATYHGTLPPSALPQTKGQFAHAMPLRPNAAAALAQLSVTLPPRGGVEYIDVKPLAVSPVGLSSTIGGESVTSQWERTALAQARLTSIDADVRAPMDRSLSGVKSLEALRGGTRQAVMAGKAAIVTKPVLAGHPSRQKWTTLHSKDIQSLFK